jgi:hypothetical protein
VVDPVVPIFVEPVLGDGDGDVESEADPEDGEPAVVNRLDDELSDELDEPVEEELLGSASAIAWLLAIATPTPSATANAPTRPT